MKKRTKGLYLFAKGNYKRAKEELEKALLIEPENEVYLFCLGSCFYELGDAEKSQAYLEKTLAIDPEFVGCYVLLGLIFAEKWIFSKGERRDFLEKAIQYYEVARKLRPEDKDINEFLQILKIYLSG